MRIRNSAEEVLRRELHAAERERDAASGRVNEHLRNLQHATIAQHKADELITSIRAALGRLGWEEEQ